MKFIFKAKPKKCRDCGKQFFSEHWAVCNKCLSKRSWWS